MRTSEEIISAHRIDNPSDAALLRLAGLAVAMPDESPEALVQRVTFSHPGDAKLALALVEVVRASAPAPAIRPGISRGKLIAGAILLVVVAVAPLLVVSTQQWRSLVSSKQDQDARWAQQVSELQNANAKRIAEVQEALRKADEAAKGNVQTFTSKMQEYVDRLTAQSSEITKLSAENLRLKSELEAALKKPDGK